MRYGQLSIFTVGRGSLPPSFPLLCPRTPEVVQTDAINPTFYQSIIHFGTLSIRLYEIWSIIDFYCRTREPPPSFPLLCPRTPEVVQADALYPTFYQSIIHFGNLSISLCEIWSIVHIFHANSSFCRNEQKISLLKKIII